MKNIKRILVGIATVVSSLLVLIWVFDITQPIAMTGCYSTAKYFGWPLQFYSTAGEQFGCGGGLVSANTNFLLLVLDILVFGTIIYWFYRLVLTTLRVLTKRENG